MKHLLTDGRELMARYDDLKAFFDKNRIIGRTIADIRPAAADYMIRNLYVIDHIYDRDAESAISTDAQICLIFADGDHLELEIPGEGPILLGWNTADLKNYPTYDGTCYTLHTMFCHCIGRKITDIIFERSEERMLFPAYCGIDMSADDEGITEIQIVLDDGSCLLARGIIDEFTLAHEAENGKELRVPFRDLLNELNPETLKQILEEE